MSVDSLIKNLRNIMRQDQGVAGDGQRIEQLGWMLFLKLYDDQERFYEMRDPKYKSPIPEALRWRNWATDPEGITGDELMSFVNNKLFPGIKNLKVRTDDKRGMVVRDALEDAFNYMKSGTTMRRVLNELNQYDFNKKSDRHLVNDFYEKLLKELQTAGDYGEFYTPRALTQFVVEMIDPKLGEIVFDPACGTGGFLINALEHVRSHYVKTQADEKKLHDAIRGVELKQLPHILASTNMIIHGVEVPDNIRHDDMLSRPLTEYGPRDRVDVIVANPPFGGVVKEGTEKNFPSDFRTKETAALFLVLFIHLLKDGGRAGIVLPDGMLFGEGVVSKIKEKLLTECNVHTIVRLPQGVFNPYAGVNTNLIFFTKGEPTKEIWYYQLPLPEGLKQYTKNRGITHEEFDPICKWWGNRKANGNAWKVSIKEIRERNYNLDFKNPNGKAGVIHKSPTELVREIEGKELEILKLLAEIPKSL
ncbi:MAG: class I SAM-dependent DNA methyltransferase [Candidatus Giovannonibacteria bacterium]|nr:class I SAM-dependent DNA methyltransferase [Candidatus Giovannonibacteria bacterium]